MKERFEIENGHDRKTTVLTGFMTGVDDVGFLTIETIKGEIIKVLPSRIILRTILEEWVDMKW